MTTDDERRNDALQVERVYAQMDGIGQYGPIGAAFTPDDAHAERIAREDDESYWTALLASPDCSTEED